MKNILLIILVVIFTLNAQALFEVKDASDNTVLEISNDGLRVFNEGDTLMVISSSEIKAFIDESAKDKALSRSFSITTSAASGKGQDDVVNIASDGLRVFSANENLMDITQGNITAYIDTSFSFNVTSTDGGKLATDVLEVASDATKMRKGDDGDQYTDFSPENVFIGLNAGTNTDPGVPLDADGKNNVFVGNQSGEENTSGRQNTSVGVNAGKNNQISHCNVYVGSFAGEENTNGGNVFVGNEAGRYGRNSFQDPDIGGGFSNTFIGYTCGRYVTGNANTFVGMSSGVLTATGSENVFMGLQAGYNCPGGNGNVYIGKGAGYGFSTPNLGSDNVYIGKSSGLKATGSGNVFIGKDSGFDETGSNRLIIDNSMIATPLIYGEFDNNLVRINGDLDVTGTATVSTLSAGNTTVNGILSTTGNTIVGGILTATGNANLNGAQTWVNHDMVNNNGLFIKNKDATDPWHFYEYSTGDLKLYFNGILRGSWDQTNGVYTSSSDKRFKKNIEEFTNVLDKLMLLSPKRYNFISQNDSEQKYIGLIAQDVKELFPAFVQYNEEDDKYTMDYAGLSVVAIQAIKEQQEEIDNLRSEIEEIKKLLNK